jgi:nucleoid-associated protein YgaU
MAALSSATTGLMIVTVLALAWNIDHKAPRDAQNKNAPTRVLHSAGLNLKVVAARTHAVASSTRTELAPNATETQSSIAEDRYLGEPAVVPRVQGACPPEPARASVDSEPEAPDDPRDFELPIEARSH